MVAIVSTGSKTSHWNASMAQDWDMLRMLAKAGIRGSSKHDTRTSLNAGLDLDGDQTRQVMSPV